MQQQVTVAVMPKALANPYFESCRQGAEEAAALLEVRLLWDGPGSSRAARKQEAFVEEWVAGRVNVIAVSAADAEAVAPALRRARQAGVSVVSWDSDCASDARSFFVMPATLEAIGKTLANAAGRILLGQGQVAVIAAAAASKNQSVAIGCIRTSLAQDYPGLELVATEFCEDDRETARALAKELLAREPDVKVLLTTCAPAVPGAAQAVKDAGRRDVRVVGLSSPAGCREFICEGIVDSVVLWNTVDLGYLTVYAAHAVATGRLKLGEGCLRAGRLGTVVVQDDQVRLGRPYIFNAANIDSVKF
jgi:rhamnose transport system substrate-binding protein